MEKTEEIDFGIINSIKNGDKDAFHFIYSTLYADLCIASNRIIQDIDISEDIVQNTICKLWEKRKDLNINQNIRFYLFRAVKNSSLNYLRHKNIIIQFESEQQASDSIDTLTPEQEFSNTELQNKISKSIDLLPEKTKNIFKLNRFDSLTYNEIATKLNISSKTVEYQISKALKHLQNNLKDYLCIFVLFFYLYKN